MIIKPFSASRTLFVMLASAARIYRLGSMRGTVWQYGREPAVPGGWWRGTARPGTHHRKTCSPDGTVIYFKSTHVAFLSFVSEGRVPRSGTSFSPLALPPQDNNAVSKTVYKIIIEIKVCFIHNRLEVDITMMRESWST